MEPQVYENVQASRQGQTTNGLAVASLILGILSLTGCGCMTGIPAIICGTMAKNAIRQDPTQTGDGFAKAGVICGWISIGLMCLVMSIYVLLIVLVGAGSIAGAGN